MTKLKHHESVSHVMTKDPVSINLATKISEAADLFAKGEYHHLPVVNGAKLVGVVSFNDMMRISYGDPFDQDLDSVWQMLDHTTSIEKIMTQQPDTLTTAASVRDAAELLAGSTFNSIPIVDESEALVGIVTSTDLIRFLVELY